MMDNNYSTIFIIYAYIILALSSLSQCQDVPTSATTAFFSANQSSTLILPSAVIEFQRKIAFSFRTCSHGQLLYQEGGGGANSVSIAISEQSSLDLTITYNSEQIIVTVGSALTDNKWYTVESSFLNGEIFLTVEQGKTVIDRILVSNSTYNRFLWDLDLSGGTGLHIGLQFTGCIQAGPSVPLGDTSRQAVNVQWDTCPLENDPNYDGCEAPTPDPCWVFPCQHGGTCESVGTEYTCTCPKTYTGENCEIDVGNEACKYSPCENGGTCQHLTNSTRTYQCNCVLGFTGVHCEININECISQPCQNGGDCVDLENGFVCDCDGTGHTNSLCSENINECLAVPCQNGASCSDTPGSYKCDCPFGYGGQNCSMTIDECVSSPCQNGGTCTDELGGYTCVCVLGFSGLNCEVNIDDCVGVVCGVPNTVCVDGVNDFSCKCKPGFSDPQASAGNATECVDVNECVSDPCQNGATCLNGENSFSCSCVAGYSGDTCELDVDECGPEPCQNGAKCSDAVNAFLCTCLPGYSDVTCNINIDDCAGAPCMNGVCHDKVDGYNCSCAAGWTGVDCEVQINECQTGPCLNNGVCLDQQASYLCVCKDGFTGEHCETNIDDCVILPCEHAGTCVDGVNTYTCQCTSDYMGQNCTQGYDACSPVFEPCKNGATCISSPPQHTYNCICATGFTGESCDINVDDCQGNSCLDFQECVDGVNTYSCQCPAGFTGRDCTDDIDECASNPCVNDATCLNLLNMYECVCKAENVSLVEYTDDPRSVYTIGYTGDTCSEDIDECLFQPPLCLNNGMCRNNAGSFECLCPGNLYASGPYCEVTIPFCTIMEQRFMTKEDGPVCHNEGECESVGTQNFVCTCLPGFTGERCKINIDECESSPCMYEGTCTDLVNGYTCVCLDGLTGSNCETNINECSSEPCQNSGECLDGINGDSLESDLDDKDGFVCNCSDTGYKGTYCEVDIFECESNPCVNNASCLDGIKDYTCECHPGYSGKNCEIDIDECESSPCQNLASCIQRSDQSLDSFSYSEAEGYDCNCVDGFTGLHCETNIDECVSSPCVYGFCEDEINQYRCQCNPGYTGTNCETEINECVLYNPCQNAAMCVDKIADYTCECAGDVDGEGKLYAGKNCSIELTGCVGHSCQNEANCVPFLTDTFLHEYRCECQFGSTGKFCHMLTTATFKRGSWLEFDNTSGMTDMSMSLRFRTTLPSGVLAFNLANMNSKYTLLQLRDGNVMEVIYHNSQMGTYNVALNSSTPLNNGEWQTVAFSVSASGIEINMSHSDCSSNADSICTASKPLGDTSMMHTLMSTYLGYRAENIDASVLDTVLVDRPGFVGCMEDVLINDEYIIPLHYINAGAKIDFSCNRTDPCEPDPCSGRGACNDLWYEDSCTCDRPYRAQTCQQTYNPATFGFEGQQSVAKFAVPAAVKEELKTKVDMSLFLRTRQTEGLIFYIGGDKTDPVEQQTYIAAQLIGGFIQADVFLDGVIYSKTLSTLQINDGNLHFFKLTFESQLLTLTVDDVAESHDIPSVYELNAKNVYIGGIPITSTRRRKRQTVDFTAPNYKGTVQDLRLNGNLLQFYPVTDPLVDEPPTLPGEPVMQNIRQGEVSDDVCTLLQPCVNNATCSNVFFNDYSCACMTGNKGKNCSELDFCLNTQCPGESTCVDLDDGFECVTPATFDGISNYVQYVPKLANLSGGIDRFSLKFRTRDEEGVILHIQGATPTTTLGVNQYITLELVKTETASGILSLTMYLGSKTVNKLETSVVNDGAWHDLTVLIEPATMQMTLDSATATFAHGITADTDLYGFVTGSNKNIYLGGLPNDYNILYSESDALTYYKGCIDEPRIGGVLLPFFLPDQFINHTVPIIFEAAIVAIQAVGCESDPVCDNNQCVNSATCVDVWNEYECTCVFGFDGEMCEYNIDDCVQHDCLFGGRCLDGVASFMCDCLPGTTGEKCETDIDECASLPCQNNATCINGNNTYECNCTEEYVGNQCQVKFGETCEFSPCQNNATCVNVTTEVDGVLTFNCSCATGYEGTFCESEIDYCGQNNQPCLNGAMCDNIPHLQTYQCQCAAGYTGELCETDIDECAAAPCLNGATCTQGIGEYTCTCVTGWSGADCEVDVDECTEAESNGTTLCENSGVCVNVDGAYECDCAGTGYEGASCEAEIDECTTVMPCRSGGDCTNTAGSYDCNCTLGYSGDNCEVASCVDLCVNGATCQETNVTDDSGTYETWECMCTEFYEGDFCEVIGPCVSQPCQNAATCTQNATHYSCDCGDTGWEGVNCSEDIDECTVNNECQNGATCNNLAGSYNCTCAQGFVGRKCEEDVDECVSNPCQNGVECQDMPGGYKCDCGDTGYEGENCETDIDECIIGDPCLNGGTCVNTVPLFECQCMPGYVGKTCHSENPCNDTDYCANDGECSHDVNEEYLNVTASCECTDPWLPPFCLEAPPTPKPASSGDSALIPIIIAVCVLAAVIIAIIVLVVVLMRVKDQRTTTGTYSPSTQEMSGSRVNMGNTLKVPPPERLI